MDKGNLSRRGFMQRSLAGLAAAGLPLWYAREVFEAEAGAAEERKKPVGPNGRIVMGAIGIGSPQSRGRAIMGEARRDKGVQYVAVCDVDKRHRERAAKEVGSDCSQFEDFRQLLDNKDINAVTIATPDHWHALIAIDALRKGKDVYCEKPLTLTVDEGKALVKVAKATGRVFQVGSQQRSEFGGRFRLACELVRNGRIGKVQRVETRIGSNPTSPSLPAVPVPEGLNWDFWLGPTPQVDYLYLAKGKQAYTNCHYEFRWWYQFSGGKMTDWGAHHNDTAQWALGMDGSGPVAVEALAQAPSKDPHRYDCHPTFTVTYTYADGTKLVCSHTQLNGAPDPKQTTSKGRDGKERQVGHDNGVLFVGEGGKWIFVNRGVITASDEKLIQEKLPGDAARLHVGDPRVAGNHMANFLDAVRKGKPDLCICPAEVGHRSATVCHLGVIALRSGKKLKWDPAKEAFAGDEEANKWLSRPMRGEWKLDV
jgi:predicted dehydrogenase